MPGDRAELVGLPGRPRAYRPATALQRVCSHRPLHLHGLRAPNRSRWRRTKETDLRSGLRFDVQDSKDRTSTASDFTGAADITARTNAKSGPTPRRYGTIPLVSIFRTTFSPIKNNPDRQIAEATFWNYLPTFGLFSAHPPSFFGEARLLPDPMPRARLYSEFFHLIQQGLIVHLQQGSRLFSIPPRRI